MRPRRALWQGICPVPGVRADTPELEDAACTLPVNNGWL